MLLQMFLIISFTLTDLILFYIIFKATFVPTLIVITRWENQAARLMQDFYFFSYTPAGSLLLGIVPIFLKKLGL